MLNVTRLRHRRIFESLNTLLLSAFLANLAFSFSANAAAPKIRFDGEVAYSNDDNVTKAARDQDIEEDSFASAAMGATYVHAIDIANRIVIRGLIRGEFFNEFDGLSNTTGSVTATYQYRGSGEFLAPTYSAFIKAGIAEYDSELRDSDLFSAGVSVRKAFTDRISGLSVLQYNVRDSDSTVFDTKDMSLLVNADYLLTQHSTLYLTYNYLVGDITSSSGAWLRAVNAAEEINIDDAFPGTWFAYRLDGKTHVVTLGVNFQLAEKHSLDFSARWINSEADTDSEIYYERLQLSAAYLIRF